MKGHKHNITNKAGTRRFAVPVKKVKQGIENITNLKNSPEER